MTDKPIKLSDTARAMLTLARTREDRLVPPPTLPVAAARQVVRSLLNNAMIEEIELPAELAEFFWREGDDGMRLGLRATEQGLAAIAHAVEVPQELEAFTQAVLGFLAEEGCNASILQDDDPRTMIADGHSNGRSAAQVAGDIVAWLEETEADAEEAEAVPAQGSVSEAVAGATGEDTAAADTTAIDAGSPGNALHAAGTPPVRVSLRQAAEAVLAVWAD
ncbi:MAG TPA: hypothetical protein VFA63_14075, partial [Pseudonocardiaceae bacterium]|nr:hypothetical protein [Pseudonocardiaceae bacterium]